MDQQGRDWDAMLRSLQSDHNGECPYPCPFCMGMGLLKQMSPEVSSHLSAAGREFLLAARAFMDSLAERNQTSRQGEVPVEWVTVEDEPGSASD